MKLLPFFTFLALLSSCSPDPSSYYPSAKPLTRWWWFAQEIKEKDIAHQLTWLKENGFGGAEIAWVYPLNRMKGDTVNITPRQPWLSDDLNEMIRYAKHFGDSLGLSIDFTFGSLWPFGDLQVPPEQSTKEFGHPEFRQWIRASWDYPKQGLVLDHLNRQAFMNYADRMGRALKPAMQTGAASAIFVDSWEVETRNLWTSGFDTMFTRRYGYDLVPFMEQDILTDSFAGQRYDYMKLVSELTIDNFYRPFTEVAHSLGGFSRGQCSGSPTDILTAYASLDVPETEAMLYEPSFSRIVASAATLGGKNIITAETFTCLYGWPREHLREEKVEDLKMVVDALFANGLNQVIWHGMPYNPAGSDSISFYASVHVGEAGALAPHIPEFNQYMQQVSAIMRKGRNYTDVAVYLPIEDAWIAGEMPKEKQYPWAWGEYELRYLEVPEYLRGYQPMWVNGEFLKEIRKRPLDNKLVVGKAEFGALLVDAQYLDIDNLRLITEIAREGIPVCVRREPIEAGFIRHPEFDTLVRELMAGSVSGWEKLNYHKPLLEGEDLPYFWAREDRGDLWVFFAHPMAKDFRYPVQYNQADIDHDVKREVTFNYRGRSIGYELVFKPGESILVKINKRGKVDRIL